MVGAELTLADEPGLKAQRPAGRTDLTLGEFAEQHLAPVLRAARPGAAAARPLRPGDPRGRAPLISAALAATNGNQIKAAELLGMNRNTLRTRVRDLGIRIVKVPG